MLISHIEDKLALCYTQDIPQYTDFLSVEEIAQVRSFLENASVYFSFWGGYEDAERCMAVISVEKTEEFPITILCGKWDRFGEVGHRDVLGALIASGVERKCIGDIIIDTENRCFYVFVTTRMANYFSQNVVSIGRCSINWSVVSDVSVLPKAKVQEMKLPVSSLRIDVILSAVYHLSRQDSQRLISEKKVFINHIPIQKATHNLQPMSCVVVRGMGKFIFLQQQGFSKKGKAYILVKQYI